MDAGGRQGGRSRGSGLAGGPESTDHPPAAAAGNHNPQLQRSLPSVEGAYIVNYSPQPLHHAHDSYPAPPSHLRHPQPPFHHASAINVAPYPQLPGPSAIHNLPSQPPSFGNWSQYSYVRTGPSTWSQHSPFGSLASPPIYGVRHQPLAQEQPRLTSPPSQPLNTLPSNTPQSSSPPSPQFFPSAAPTPSGKPPRSPPPIPTNTRTLPMMIQTGVKRKADSEPGSASSSGPMSLLDMPFPPAKMTKSRTSSGSGFPTTGVTSQPDPQTAKPRSQSNQETMASPGAGSGAKTPRLLDDSATAAPEIEGGMLSTKDLAVNIGKSRRIAELPRATPSVLPAGRVFPIQIGTEMFRLSGASISSDAPSYFSNFFSEQLHSASAKGGELKTLYIDRDPATFRDIVLHLQGYHVRPLDSEHFVKLFADAQFYSLPRLTQQLFKSEIFVQIGDTHFQIPRDLFSAPGDSPNFFSLGFAHFFTTPSEVFPGLDRENLLRPPAILPPSVPNRSGRVFSDLVRLLQGYQVDVRDEKHRAELLRDARYYHFKGLEQRLLPHDISFNIMRNTSEIVIRLEDIRQSGVSFLPDTELSSSGQTIAQTPSPATSPSGTASQIQPGYVSYARPYTDDQTHVLILETGSPESMRLHFSPGSSPNTLSIRATFVNQTLARISSLLQVIANKMGLPATQPLGLMMMQSGGGVAAQPISPANSGVSGERVKVRIGKDAYVDLDGEAILVADEGPTDDDPAISPRLLKKSGKGVPKGEEEQDEMVDAIDLFASDENSWIVRRAHWRLRVVPNEENGRMEVIMSAVRIEAFSSERARNASRGFLA